jgi:hypothetical protein
MRFRVVQVTESLNASYGSTGLVGNNVLRFTFGYQYLDNQFPNRGRSPPSTPCVLITSRIRTFPEQHLPAPESKTSGPIFNLRSSRPNSSGHQLQPVRLGGGFQPGERPEYSLWLSLKDFEADSSQSSGLTDWWHSISAHQLL